MSFPMFNFNPNPEDIRYLSLDTIVQSKGPDRLKYLDLEGRWILSGRSISYISAVFNHIEKLNYSKGAIFDIVEPALKAIGSGSSSPDEQKVKKEVAERKKIFTIPVPPVVAVDKKVPPSPREIVPYRSAGYGPAHQKRNLSIPNHSRSSSVNSHGTSPVPENNKYAIKYGSKDNVTWCGAKWGSSGRDDPGYESAISSNAPSPNLSYLKREDAGVNNRYPHRTQTILPSPEHRLVYDSDYDPSFLKKANESYQNASIEIKTRADRASQYGRRRNIDCLSGSEQSSPSKKPQTAEEYLLESYHRICTTTASSFRAPKRLDLFPV